MHGQQNIKKKNKITVVSDNYVLVTDKTDDTGKFVSKKKKSFESEKFHVSVAV